LKVIIECFNPEARPFKPQVKKILSQLDRILRLENNQLEVYLVDNRVTKNVLAYRPPPHFPRPDLQGRRPLGDLCLNFNPDGLIPNLVHGLLHLLGYNHQKKDDRIKMEAKENELIRAIHKS